MEETVDLHDYLYAKFCSESEVLISGQRAKMTAFSHGMEGDGVFTIKLAFRLLRPTSSGSPG